MSTLTTTKPAAETVAQARKGSRTAINFWIDLLTAVSFAVLLGTSFLMKYILPPGTCDGDGVKVWLGHSRHWWGDIHFLAAVAMVALIVAHVWLHWSWVTGAWGKLLGGLKSPVTWGALVVMAGVMAVPWIIPAQQLEVMAAPDHFSIAHEDGEHAGEPAAAAAPCGVEGLSCSDCPAADDRLLGGGCSVEEGGEAPLEVLTHGYESGGE